MTAIGNHSHAMGTGEALHMGARMMIGYCQWKMNLSDATSAAGSVLQQIAAINVLGVKVAQGMATNGGVFTDKQRAALAAYTDDVPYGEDDILVDAYAAATQPTSEGTLVFEDAVDQPYKSGTVALVYRATIAGKRVVVKIVRRGIAKRLREAIESMEKLYWFAAWIPSVKAMNIGAVLEDNQRSILQQTDCRTELENLQKMKRQFEHTDYVLIPEAYPAFTERDSRVLVMDYVDGMRLDDITESDYDAYATLVAQLQAKMLLYDRFYHADLHAGNMRFIRDADGTLKLGVFDFGITGETDDRQRDTVLSLLANVNDNSSSESAYAFASTLLDKAVEPPERAASLTPKERTEIITACLPVVRDTMHGSAGVQIDHINQINALLSRKKLRIAHTFCKLQMALLAIGGVCSRLQGDTPSLVRLRQATQGIGDLLGM